MWFLVHGVITFLWCFLTNNTLNEFIVGSLFGGVITIAIARTAGIQYEKKLFAVAWLAVIVALYVPISNIATIAWRTHRQRHHITYQLEIDKCVWLFALFITLTTQAEVTQIANGTLKLTVYANEATASRIHTFIHLRLERPLMLLHSAK